MEICQTYSENVSVCHVTINRTLNARLQDKHKSFGACVNVYSSLSLPHNTVLFVIESLVFYPPETPH